MKYLDPREVSEVVSTGAPLNRYRGGYGSKIPTKYLIKIGTRKHRVYVMCYSNSGTAYILKGGDRLVVDWELSELEIAKRMADKYGPTICKEFGS